MSSNPVDLSSEHSGSQNYVRDMPANQRLVDDSQTATSVGPRLREGTEAALINPSVARASSSPKKKKKISLVKGVKVPITSGAIPSVPSTSVKGKDRGGEIAGSADDCFGLRKKFEDATAENQKLREESSNFDIRITQPSATLDAALEETKLAR
ncbi:hypothetical protein LIER_39051 [Lithospermum erythrorhizon]|uniref:Uncharacterized protein n=1 Tax=Lithospermum erythrorhizon TaxID=34254 RepID=A0AAV3QCY1_LITER